MQGRFADFVCGIDAGAFCDEDLCQFQMPFLRGEVKRRVADSIGQIDGSAMRQENFDNGRVPLPARFMKWSHAVDTLEEQFSPIGQQQRRHTGMAFQRGQMQRRVAGLVRCVDIGALGDQQLRQRAVPLVRRRVQERVAIQVRTFNPRGVRFEQLLDALDIAGVRRRADDGGPRELKQSIGVDGLTGFSGQARASPHDATQPMTSSKMPG